MRERVSAGLAASVVVVLLVLASMPLTDDGDDEAVVTADGLSVVDPGVAGGPAAEEGAPVGDPGAAAATPASSAELAPTGDTAVAAPDASTAAAPTGGPAAAASAPGGAPAGAAAAAGGCGALTASAPGVTAKELLVDVSLVSLAGPVGNEAVGVRPDLHDIVKAIVAETNKTGGVACGRKLVAKIYDVNPIDSRDQNSKCLQMVSDKPFVVLDNAGYTRPVGRSCFVQNKLPVQTSQSATEVELKRSAPFIYGLSATSERQVRNGILGLAERGFFAAPKFQKLGLFLEACVPEVNAEIDALLAKVGVKPSQVVKFTIGCSPVAPPSEIAQGVLQHKSAGATHVFLASAILNSQNYVRLAAQQDFRPVYGASDFGSTSAAPTAEDWDASFNGASIVTSTHSGGMNSGSRTAEAAACDKILRAHGRPGIETEARDGTALLLCDNFALFRAMLDKAGPNPTRDSYIGALARLGTFRTSGLGDGQFDRPGKYAGGDFRRAIQWQVGCKCFKLLEPNFRPGF